MTNLSLLNDEFSKPYQFLLMFLKYTCIDIFNERNIIIYKIKCIHYIVFVIHILNAISMWCSVIDTYNDGADFLDMSTDLSYGYNLIEVCTIYPHICLIRKRIENFVVKLETQWRSDDTLSTDAVLLKRYQVRKLNLYNSGYCVGLASYVAFYVSTPLLLVIVKKFVLNHEDVVYATVWEFKLPFNYKDSFIKYLIAYAVDVMSSFNLALTLNCYMYLLAISLNQLRILFLLLQIDFKEIIQSNCNDIDITLKKAIQRHSFLSELLSEVGEAYGGIFAIRIFFLSGTVCFYAISARINCILEDFADLAISLLIVVVFFYVAMCGQLVTDAALDIAVVVYNSPWEELSCKNKRMLIFTIMRSQQAAYIRSTSFTEISLNTFTKIMKICWSLISLVTKFIDN